MRVAVFGAGIAGLTAAHELVRRGHEVSVYEALAVPGGFFRGERSADGLPAEYSWHGMGPWYHNTYDLLRQIPFDAGGSVYDRAVSRPIDFGVAPDDGVARFDDTRVVWPRAIFRMTRRDVLCWAWVMLRQWTAGRRSEERYARVPAAEAWGRVLTDLASRTWNATFGPWVGSDWTRVSWHQVGLFYRKHLIVGRSWPHPADEEGGPWLQRSRTGWLLFRGPSQEAWFGPWVAGLEAQGVRFRWEAPLRRLHGDRDGVRWAELATGERVEADAWVVATNPYAAAEIVARTPSLAALDGLRDLGPLTRDEPHVQVAFRVAFAERIAWPRPRTALVIADSEYDLTLFAQEQAWRPGVALGEGVASLWTVTACVATVPGRVHGLPLLRCTREQFLEEVMAQLRACDGLDRLVREANGGRSWKDVPIVRVEVWREWEFSPEGLRGLQPKWVNTTRTQPWLPAQRTPVPNLVLAGAHTRTDADLWSIEAAVESGRRAAAALDPRVEWIPEHVPGWIRRLRRLDDALYAVGAPQVLDVAAAGLLALALGLGWRVGRGAGPRRRRAARPRARPPR